MASAQTFVVNSDVYKGSCDSEDGTCHFNDDYDPYDIAANDIVVHDYEEYDPDDETSNDNLLRVIFGIVVFFALLCCVCSFFYLLDKDKIWRPRS